MAKHPSLLDRVRSTPDLAKVVPHLPPDVLHRVIQTCGLEDSGELLAAATPRQIEQILDVDVWRARAAGGDEQLDVERFGTWLVVLMDSGADAAARKLAAMDVEFLIAALSGHLRVFDRAAVSPYTTLAGETMPGRDSEGSATADIGGYAIVARRTTAWDAIVELLGQLEGVDAGYFHRLMRGCVRQSNGPREPDGFHALLEDQEQDLFDLACRREERREKRGYVTPAQARAFLDEARRHRFDRDAPGPNPIARAYFSSLGGDGPADATAEPQPEPIARFTQMLHEEGVLASTPPRALLPAAEGDAPRFPFVRVHLESHAGGAEELAFLVNVLLAGCSLQMRPFTPQQASDAAAATCNLGLENWPSRWPHPDLVSAFQAGWARLHVEVCTHAARRLVEIAGGIRCRDRDIQLRLGGLQRELARQLDAGAPWRAQPALDVLMMLDPRSWIALVAATDECPVLHAAIAASGPHTIEPGDFSFISDNSQVAAVRAFVETLPSRLRP